jgi:hypothetical protein
MNLLEPYGPVQACDGIVFFMYGEVWRETIIKKSHTLTKISGAPFQQFHDKKTKSFLIIYLRVVTYVL